MHAPHNNLIIGALNRQPWLLLVEHFGLVFLAKLEPPQRIDFFLHFSVIKGVGLDGVRLDGLVVEGGVDLGGARRILASFGELSFLFLGHCDNKYNEVVVIELLRLQLQYLPKNCILFIVMLSLQVQ